MKIEFWSDVICPWCGLMQHRLKSVLAAAEFGDQVEVVHRSFPLHPELDRNGVSQGDLFEMYGIPKEAGIEMIRGIEGLAAADGLTPYHALDRTLGPTDYINELLAFATERGQGERAWDAAFREHFGEARRLWTVEQVLQFAADLGLDGAEARDALRTRRYQSRVEADRQAAIELGARGVPLLRLAGGVVLKGAVDTATLAAAVDSAWKSEHRRPVGADIDAAQICEPDGCAVPGSGVASSARGLS